MENVSAPSTSSAWAMMYLILHLYEQWEQNIPDDDTWLCEDCLKNNHPCFLCGQYPNSTQDHPIQWKRRCHSSLLIPLVITSAMKLGRNNTVNKDMEQNLEQGPPTCSPPCSQPCSPPCSPSSNENETLSSLQTLMNHETIIDPSPIHYDPVYGQPTYSCLGDPVTGDACSRFYHKQCVEVYHPSLWSQSRKPSITCPLCIRPYTTPPWTPSSVPPTTVITVGRSQRRSQVKNSFSTSCFLLSHSTRCCYCTFTYHIDCIPHHSHHSDICFCCPNHDNAPLLYLEEVYSYRSYHPLGAWPCTFSISSPSLALSYSSFLLWPPETTQVRRSFQAFKVPLYLQKSIC